MFNGCDGTETDTKVRKIVTIPTKVIYALTIMMMVMMMLAMLTILMMTFTHRPPRS